MSIQNAYNDWSSSYDSDENRTRDLDRKIMQEVLTGQRLDSILEIGCGTGKNTVFLAEIGTLVHAIDFSNGMIEKALEKVKAGNVRFSVADLTQTWPSRDEAYQLVVCSLVLEHIADLSFIFSEAYRVLRQGGRFLINELHPFRQYEGTKARFERMDSLTEIQAFTHHISDFVHAATQHGLRLVELNECWHADDPRTRPPRIVSFVFEK